MDNTVAEQLNDDVAAPRRRIDEQSRWSWDDGLLLRDNIIYVPNDDALRLEIMRMHHDDTLAGHYGNAKTYELLARNYWFPGMTGYVKKYVDSCETCARGKASRHRRHSELAPLPAPAGNGANSLCRR